MNLVRVQPSLLIAAKSAQAVRVEIQDKDPSWKNRFFDTDPVCRNWILINGTDR